MNLIDESLEDRRKKDSNKKLARIILICIVILFLLIIGIVIYLAYVENSKLKVSVDGAVNADVKDMLVFETDGTIYVPIRTIASYLGYSSYNGEYNNASEDISKCYIQCDNEIVNFNLNSNKIYKLNLSDSDENYSYLYMDKPVKAINGVLYITTDGMQKAFNSLFQYDKDRNRIAIYTMPYLINLYQAKVLDYGYTKINENFENYKAILQGMLVVQNEQKQNQFAVINADTGEEILECKYDSIEYQEDTGDFLVTDNEKVGIMSKNREIKVDILYDNIELMDLDAGLYIVEKEGQYGVIDLKGNTKIYIENDEIGVDISNFPQNDLKNRYILVGNMIPVKKGDKWGFFDKNGNQLVDFEYDSLGYTAKSSRDAMNLLVIPGYDVVVACAEERYTLLNASGVQPFPAFVDDIYMTISGGQKHYYMTSNNNTYDVEDYLDRIGVRADGQSSSNSNSSSSSNSNSNQTDENEESSNQEQNNEQGEEQNSNQEEQSNGENVEENQEQSSEENNQENVEY